MSSAAKGGAQTGVVRRAWDAAVDFMLRKEMVGTDKHGNKYYRYFETNRGDKVERREVKWNTVYMMYDPNDVPSEWRMWLRKLRDNPPTQEELAQGDNKAQVLRGKVAALDEQERLRRLRMQSMGMHAQQASQQPDISRLLQQMAPESSDAKPAAAGGSSQGGVKPQTSAEPAGSGEKFSPGVWKP